MTVDKMAVDEMSVDEMTSANSLVCLEGVGGYQLASYVNDDHLLK